MDAFNRGHSLQLHQKVKFKSGNKVITVMIEEDILVPASSMVPFNDTQQMDSTSKCHSSEFVLINYKLEGKVFLEPKLSKAELMIGRPLIKIKS